MPSNQTPLRIEEQQALTAILLEMKSRGIEMPKDYQNLLNPEPAKASKWRLGGNGYFLKDDGSQYKPAPQQAAFIKSNARFVSARAGRGCIAPETLIGDIPVSEITTAHWVNVMGGDKAFALPPFLKGHDDLYTVCTHGGNSITVTLDHKFLTFVYPDMTDKVWKRLGDLVVGDAIFSNSEIIGDYWDRIKSISYDRFGEYWDFTVPELHHYLAQGIYNHNSGKSGAGAQKAMFKIAQGEDGAVINPVFSDFKTSTWPEFKRWIDWNMVVPSQKHRRSDAWSPHQPFTMVFTNGAKVYCKGLKDPKSARGANINWLWYDEAASDLTGMAWRIAVASVRVGKNPQAWATTTPKGKEHWFYKFFIEQDIPQEAVELLAKDDRILIDNYKWSIIDNKDNLDPAYYASVISAFPSGWLRAQEVDGEFAEEGGKVGDRTWFDGKIRNAPPEVVNKRVRFWDLAATEKKQASDDPDEAVGTLLSKRYEPEIKKDIYCIEHQVFGFWEWKQLIEAIANTARHDGMEVPIILEEEPGSGGKNQVAAVKEYIKTFPELKYHKVIGQSAKKVGDRVMAANHWFAVAAEGRFEMVKGSWNEKTLSQVDGFTQILHDDRVTSVTGAFSYVTPFKSWVRVPFFSVGGAKKEAK